MYLIKLLIITINTEESSTYLRNFYKKIALDQHQHVLLLKT